MKLQCDLCREIVVADFEVVAPAPGAEDAGGRGAIVVQCPACARRFTVAATRGPDGAPAPAPAAAAPPAAAPPAPAPPAFDGPAMTCPKCGEHQPAREACRACGLRAERMADFAAADATAAAPEVIAAWRACEDAWADAAAHERLVQAAAAHGAYAWIARRYREVQRARPDDAVAAARLAGLTRLTEATLRASAAPRAAAPAGKAARPYAGAIGVLVLLVVIVVAGTVYALVRTRGASDDEGAVVPAVPITSSPGR